MSGLRGGIITRFEKFQKMSIDEMAENFAIGSKFPHSACYICRYDGKITCNSPDDFYCTDEYTTELYKKWLSEESAD